MTIPTQVKTLFLAWQDYQSRSWFSVGRLTFDGEKYKFVYVNGAREAQQKCGFEPLLSFPKLDEVYSSTYLFPVFANRLMSPSRPEYKSFLERLNLQANKPDPMLMLARSEGKRETDSLTVFPYPEVDEEGKYHLHFFAHGVRHLPDHSIERINQLKKGEELWLAHEFQNEYDSKALILTTKDHYILGYCPRYLINYVFEIVQRQPNYVDVRVERVNLPPTPLQFRLFCGMSYTILDDVQPFSQEEYQPITQEELIAEISAV
jgi:hypothetical protein